MFSNMYETIEDIGQGAYGKVVKARDKQTGRLVAIKQLKTQSTEEGIPQTTLREITFLKDLDHPNIVKLLNVVGFFFADFQRFLFEALGKREDLLDLRVLRVRFAQTDEPAALGEGGNLEVLEAAAAGDQVLARKPDPSPGLEAAKSVDRRRGKPKNRRLRVGAELHVPHAAAHPRSGHFVVPGARDPARPGGLHLGHRHVGRRVHHR